MNGAGSIRVEVTVVGSLEMGGAGSIRVTVVEAGSLEIEGAGSFRVTGGMENGGDVDGKGGKTVGRIKDAVIGSVGTGRSVALIILSDWRNRVCIDQCLKSLMEKRTKNLVCVKLEFASQDGPSDVVQ
jgi:hypothetical protein